MEKILIKNLSFRYHDMAMPVFENISLSVESGDFVLLCGRSGCGKSTLLKNLKPDLTPYGYRDGTVLIDGVSVTDLTHREQSQRIGFVMQNPDNQIVTDQVWHEIAFGLENLGYSNTEIRARVAETASFLGIGTWFHKRIEELSGGQKQILNLASVMAMQPEVLVLDEPTSQLDPIAASEFLQILKKINIELGITVILSEQRLEDVFWISDKIMVMDGGRIIVCGSPQHVGYYLQKNKSDMSIALPAAMRIYGAVEDDENLPVSIADGRKWLMKYVRENNINKNYISVQETGRCDAVSVLLEEVHFRYNKNLPEVLSGLSCKVYKGEVYSIVGGNGAGKTTTISIIGGLSKCQSGMVKVNSERIAILPQNPEVMFIKKTVEAELCDMVDESNALTEEKLKLVKEVASFCNIGHLLEQHPYDLSCGEKQRLGLAKVLLSEPDVLLLDEPTKGLDAHFKAEFGEMLMAMKKSGITIIMVSHDIEFCAQYSDRCGLMFDGIIVSEDNTRTFFADKCYYTTAANRISRGILNNMILNQDIICCCGGRLEQKRNKKTYNTPKNIHKPVVNEVKDVKRKFSLMKVLLGILFFVLSVATYILYDGKFMNYKSHLVTIAELLFCGISLNFFIPKTKKTIGFLNVKNQRTNLHGRTIWKMLAILVMVPLTIYLGTSLLGDRKYYFISLLIILEIMLPFVLAFEERKPGANELVVISVLCVITVLGRSIFCMLPQFKPTLALIIISGIAFGGETGFLVGAVSAFVSNFFFGQGPWTPWQMFCNGIVGFAAGVIFHRNIINKTKIMLCIFGGFATVFIYGGIMNPASALMYQPDASIKVILTYYITSLPYDLIHAASTVFFLWFLSEPMLEKLERVKTKYEINL